MLRRLIGENIELVWSPSSELWPIKVDPTQIDQIMANLCANARDAIDSVGVITIATENVTVTEHYHVGREDVTPGEYVQLTVSDTGCGIDKNNQEHLFEPFFTTKEIGRGTGLGLATVFGAVRQNNGFIYVYSELGLGTTFKIYLPRNNESVAESIAMVQGVLERGTETILLVEDEIALLELGKSILEQYGYTVLAAGCPADALALAQQSERQIDLLVSDVVMPGMNGKQLRDRLIMLRPDLKTLYMSGYTADVIAHHGVIDEDVYFLQKPFSEQTLLFTVRQILDRKTNGQEV